MDDAAGRMAKNRAKDRDLVIPPPRDLIRRRDCLADIYQFLPTYFGSIFHQPFTVARRTMVDALLHAARWGGDQSVAGPRGDGKTRSALFGALSLELQQVLRFPLVISKSGPRAHRELRNLKDAIRDSEPFREDFPELCVPVLNACRWPSKARLQTVHGAFADMEWGEEAIIFPRVSTELLRNHEWRDLPDDIVSVSDGQIIASLGIEGPIRGYSIRNERPDLAIIDDIDDRESARSQLQTGTREQIIEEDVGGLGGPDRTIARIMLCTLINRTCIAATFTDPALKPSWRPQRHKLLLKLPERTDLWEEYIDFRKGRANDDPDARQAHAFYLANREAMDAGAEVTNPYRFDSRPLMDGEPGQVSALQACYDVIADREWEHFNTEYQNDPPEEEGPQESGISEALIQSRMNGYPRAIVPAGCQLVIGMDIGDNRCHWVALAAGEAAAYYVVDWGFIDTLGTSPEDTGEHFKSLPKNHPERRATVEHQIRRGVVNQRDDWIQHPFTNEGGEVVEPSLVLLDSGSGMHRDVIYSLHRDLGKPFVPAKGFGQGRGKFHQGKETATRRIGEQWAKVRQDDAGYRDIWLHEFDADHWKRFVHQRFLTPSRDDNGDYRCGSMSLFQSPQSHRHAKYARQVANEVWIEEFIPGKGPKRYWDKRGANHWLDASAMACVAMSMIGVRVVGGQRKRSVKSMADMQAQARKSG